MFGRTARLRRLWHAACVLEIDPTTIDADHVGLYAATMLSRSDAANVVWGPPSPKATSGRISSRHRSSAHD